ncbi:MAG: MYG1 family protein [Candidatus Pacebacteria bacterium]|nr:MYG1 family protein [Candidatus Paceibacterota bacterium]
MLKKPSRITVVTHGGFFHPDDVFSVAVLKLLLEKFKLIRSRDLKYISEADYVVDVGGVYDPKKKRFDHHQEGGAGKRDNGIPYASFGLVWKEYGQKITGSEKVAALIDEMLVQPIDAMDNGKMIVRPIFGSVMPYTIEDMFFAYEAEVESDPSNPKIYDQIFAKVLDMALTVLRLEIKKAQHKVSDNQKVRKIYTAWQAQGGDPRLMILPSRTRFFAKDFPKLLFVVYKDANDHWSIKGVSAESDADTFARRKYFPAAWAGKKDAELASVTGVPDALFCHNGRFIAVAKSKKGALELARLALQ